MNYAVRRGVLDRIMPGKLSLMFVACRLIRLGIILGVSRQPVIKNTLQPRGGRGN
jgi:hypothetical protein